MARLPRVATPSAIPISPLVSDSAPAEPARSVGTDPTTMSVPRAAGAATLLLGGAALVASAPVTATVAAVAVTAYGLWSAGNYVVDHWSTIRDTATRVTTQIGETAGRAWQGISNGYGSAIGWARGLLGGGPRLAGA